MSEENDVVKVIYEGVNRRGFAIRPGEAVYFAPGLNLVPKDKWDRLIADKSSGSVNLFLNNRQMRLADESAQVTDNLGDMTVHAAVELVENAMDDATLEQYIEHEHSRKRGARKTVIDAIDARQKMFAEWSAAEKKAAERDEE